MAAPDHQPSASGSPLRVAVAALVLSAGAFVGIAQHEGYRETAYLPTPQDVPTIGYGTTAGVKLGDRITPDRALIRLLDEADSTQKALRACIKAPLTPYEWDAYVSWSYNVGTSAACNSTLVRKLNSAPPDYPGACAELLRWDKQAGRTLPGLTKRRRAEYETCSGR